MNFAAVGVIGNKGLKPRMTWSYKNRQGQGRVRVPFIRFSMFCEDFTQAAQLNPNTGRMERPREIVQIILPENDRGQKLFELLSPGRTVRVEGRMTTRPSIGKDSEGRDRLYSNIMVYMSDLQFMDSPIERQVNRCIGILQAAGAITEDVGKDLVTKANVYLAHQQEQYGPPREMEDRTKMDTGSEPTDTPPMPGDIDRPDFLEP